VISIHRVIVALSRRQREKQTSEDVRQAVHRVERKVIGMNERMAKATQGAQNQHIYLHTTCPRTGVRAAYLPVIILKLELDCLSALANRFSVVISSAVTSLASQTSDTFIPSFLSSSTM
jgi:hypothetical protein